MKRRPRATAIPSGAALSSFLGLATATLAVALGCAAPASAPPPAAAPLPAAAPPAGAPAPPAPLSAAALMAHVDHLASASLRGREAGTDDERRAAEYVAGRLDEGGVPAPASGRMQPVELGGGRSQNVLALVAGRGPLAGEVVVVGAHVDHLGVRGGVLFPGAEDNASGVAVALEIARALAGRDDLGRGVLFAFFGAEEIGMVGSRAFVRSPPVPLERVAVMVNIDMIGRPLVDQAGFDLPKRALGIDDRAVGLVGAKGCDALHRLVVLACEPAGVVPVAPEDFPLPFAKLIETQTEGRGDNAPFAAAGVPAIFFGSGESDDYHQPTDVPATLSPDLLARRAQAILRTVIALSRVERGLLAECRAPIRAARGAGREVEGDLSAR